MLPLNKYFRSHSRPIYSIRKYRHQLLAGIAERYDTSALIRDAMLSSLQDHEFAFLQRLVEIIFLAKARTSQGNFPGNAYNFHCPKEKFYRAYFSFIDVRCDKDSFGWKEKAVLTGISIQGKNTKIKPIRLRSAPAILTHQDIKNDTTTASMP